MRPFVVVRDSARRSPGLRRIRYLDEQGHRHRAGGFDDDPLEIMTNYGHEFL